jgi:hypothetical protein
MNEKCEAQTEKVKLDKEREEEKLRELRIHVAMHICHNTEETPKNCIPRAYILIRKTVENGRREEVQGG